jgi:RimJ/RimL family protein N-acetyltransferase
MRVVRASVPTSGGLAQLRDLEDSDVEIIVRYWFGSGDAHLDFLGIDRKLLGTENDTYQRFQRAIPAGREDQPNIGFAITLDGAFVGYTLLNRYDPQTNYSHWHITDSVRRAAGLSSALYPWRIKTYFDAAPLERLIHQTRTRNLAVNRMLDKYVPIAETVHLEHPDGVALPGEFHHRFVHRADIPHLFEIAAMRGLHRPGPVLPSGP